MNTENKRYPKISIIILTKNSERTIADCLKYISMQDYPQINEVLLIDGGSTDRTLSIAQKSKLPIRVIDGGYPTNQEARRAVGIEHARNEYCVSVDSDNYMLSNSWISDMVKPLLIEKNLAASQTLRYAVPPWADMVNRYFGLIGCGDPVAYYLGKTDRLSWAKKTWDMRGRIIKENDDYYLIAFDQGDYPTVGCNGLVFKKSILLKSQWKNPEEYFHTDVFVDIGKKGFNTFAIVKNDIYHYSAGSLMSYFLKRSTYMETHHQQMHRKRRYLVFDPRQFSDKLRLVLYILYSITFIKPLLDALIGFARKPDVAWFLHPVICFITTITYTIATIKRIYRSILA